MSADTTRAMDDWTPHRQLSLAQARARTQIVIYLRFGLVAAAVVTLSVFLAFIARNAYDRARGANDAIDSDEIVVMINPRFTGRDGDGDLYVITADSAERRRSDADLIDLINPRLVDAFNSEITAPLGLFDRAGETLDLYEDVLLIDPKGYIFNSTHAQVRTRSGQVMGLEPLDGTGPLGDIRADSYQLDNDSGIVTFKGRVQHTILDPDEGQQETSE